MYKSTLLGLSFIAALFVGNAQALEFGRPIKATVTTTTHQTHFGRSLQAEVRKKEVYLMNIKLSPQQKQHFAHLRKPSNLMLTNPVANLPHKFDLGMNNVPVLDQGPHGSCVTFANSAAIDAILGKGDYISQLCSLELGSYLEKRGYFPSGWDGSNGPIVLNQLMQFGLINKDNQRLKTCGGLSEYPNDPYNIGTAVSLDEYKQMSEDISYDIYWESMLTFFQLTQWDSEPSDQRSTLLKEIKQNIVIKGDEKDKRITFAVLLPIEYCSVGACARYHAPNDTWALTNEIKNASDPMFGGHEMIITGYDDYAIAIDNNGVKHKGLFILRNSWGEDVGDHGTYYMTYDFFTQYVFEVQKILYFKD